MTSRKRLAFFLAFAFATMTYARERGPRVEVVCAVPPIPVKLNTQQVLVYELHVTNFDVVPLTLKRVEVFANDESSAPLITLADDKLSATIMHIGAPMNMSDKAGGGKDVRATDPGARSVIFLWIELPLTGSRWVRMAIPVTTARRATKTGGPGANRCWPSPMARSPQWWTNFPTTRRACCLR